MWPGNNAHLHCNGSAELIFPRRVWLSHSAAIADRLVDADRPVCQSSGESFDRNGHQAFLRRQCCLGA